MFEKLFECVICQGDVTDYSGRNGRDRQLSPICRYCEGYYSDKSPKSGSFMDRRKLCQLSAISNALLSEASCKQWEMRDGRTRL